MFPTECTLHWHEAGPCIPSTSKQISRYTILDCHKVNYSQLATSSLDVCPVFPPSLWVGLTVGSSRLASRGGGQPQHVTVCDRGAGPDLPSSYQPPRNMGPFAYAELAAWEFAIFLCAELIEAKSLLRLGTANRLVCGKCGA